MLRGQYDSSHVCLLEKKAGRQLGWEKYFGSHFLKTGIREHMDNGCILRPAVMDNIRVCKERDLKKYFFVILPVQEHKKNPKKNPTKKTKKPPHPTKNQPNKQTKNCDQDLFSFAA